MDTISFQDFLLKLSLHTSIIKHNSIPNPNHKGTTLSIQKIQHKMEQNFPIIAKKLWKTVRVAYIMLRKNVHISKPKLLADLGLAIKRSKIAGKAAMHDDDRRNTPNSGEKRKRSSASPEQPSESELLAAAMVEIAGAATPPGLPGFGRTPRVRQLRVTDSPFPVVPPEIEEEDVRVDEEAEKFIMKFYRDLKRQNTLAS